MFEEEIYRKSNYRATKALMKVYDQGSTNKKKNPSESVNVTGLDIRKIPFISNHSINVDSEYKLIKMR